MNPLKNCDILRDRVGKSTRHSTMDVRLSHVIVLVLRDVSSQLLDATADSQFIVQVHFLFPVNWRFSFYLNTHKPKTSLFYGADNIVLVLPLTKYLLLFIIICNLNISFLILMALRTNLTQQLTSKQNKEGYYFRRFSIHINDNDNLFLFIFEVFLKWTNVLV